MHRLPQASSVFRKPWPAYRYHPQEEDGKWIHLLRVGAADPSSPWRTHGEDLSCQAKEETPELAWPPRKYCVHQWEKPWSNRMAGNVSDARGREKEHVKGKGEMCPGSLICFTGYRPPSPT